jgi:membrane associated rhomboid family serine protease
MQGYRQPIFSNTPPVVKNLLIINVLMLLGSMALDSMFHTNLNYKLGLYYPLSSEFEPYQIVTHMFMHGDLFHLFFNMFALWMFGRVLESVWGPKRFFIYYFVTGLGAAALHMFVHYLEVQSIITDIGAQQSNLVMNEGANILHQGKNYVDSQLGQLNLLLNTPTVGASGAVFGVLLAFGMLFPNTQLMLLFPPIPIKAKWLVIGYGALELWLGLTNSASNIAHFAHLGGMLFGFILIKYWNSKGKKFY